MRTKVLLSAAALAAGLATSAVAQSNVYSLNVVGYYNVPVPANTYVLVANQLNTTNNTLGGIIPAPEDGAQFQAFVSGGLVAYVYSSDDAAWSPNGNADLAPGKGGYFKSPVATTLTFVGEVKQGSLTNSLPINQYAIRASVVPQQGRVTTDLGYPAEDGDQIQVYNGSFSAYVYSSDDVAWGPSEPTNYVGQAFFTKKSPGSTQSLWVRNFTVQ